MKKILTPKERKLIFSKISINPITECWIWSGAKNRGYGAFNLRGKTTKVHRLLYEVFIGQLPKYDGINVLDHIICNNPSCCNPRHVKLVKQTINMIRSSCPSAINARKTHCIRGHLLPSPTEPYGNGKLGRRCVTCRRIVRRRLYYAKKSR